MDNLVILLLIPLIGACVLAFVHHAQTARYLAILVAVLALLDLFSLALNFVPDASMQFVQKVDWIPSMGIHFHIGLDGISLPMVILTNVLIPLIILASFKHDYKGGFYALVLFMQFGLLLVFTALDAFLFYVGWEVALIPIYFICARWGSGDKVKVNIKFFIYTFLGSLLMLVGILYLHTQVPDKNFELDAFYALALSPQSQAWVFWAFFIAFAIKIPIIPFHTWQPDTYTVAPTAGTMLLAGIMLKMGLYGLIRWLIPVVPEGVAAYGDLVFYLAIIGVVYASIIAFQQNNIKRLVAYSSIAHVGLIAAGIFSWNVQGLQGAIIQMLNHGVNVIGLFLVTDIVIRRAGTADLSALGGLARSMPKLAIVFLVVVMAAVGLPLTNGFVGEFLLLAGVFQEGAWFALFGGLTIILGAVYLLRMYQRVMLGEPQADVQIEDRSDLSGSELIVSVILVLIIIGVGVYPNFILHLSEASVEALVETISF